MFPWLTKSGLLLIHINTCLVNLMYDLKSSDLDGKEKRNVVAEEDALHNKLLVSDKESEGEKMEEDMDEKVGEDQQPAEASSSKDEKDDKKMKKGKKKSKDNMPRKEEYGNFQLNAI